MPDLRERLQELADAAARDGVTPGPAHAIHRGRQRRRRIIGGLASLLLVAVVAGAAGTGRLGDRPPGPVAPPGVPSTTVPPEVRADPVPDEVAAQLWEDTKSALRECGVGKAAGPRLIARGTDYGRAWVLGARPPRSGKRDVLGQRRGRPRRGRGGGSQRVGGVAQPRGRGQRQLRRQPRLGATAMSPRRRPWSGWCSTTGASRWRSPPSGRDRGSRSTSTSCTSHSRARRAAGRSPRCSPWTGRDGSSPAAGPWTTCAARASRGRPGPRRRPRRRRWWRRRRSGRRRSGRAR